MEAEVYNQMAELEDRHWWFVGRRRIVQAVLKRVANLGPNARVLDAGCGTGGNLELLSQFGDVIGMDVNNEALEIARGKKFAPVVKGRLPDAMPFPKDHFDLIVLLDVLEHLDDDRRVVESVVRVLKPGGFLLLTVPAFQFLWSGHDKAHHHQRRYRKPEIATTLEKAGLSVRYISYFNTWLFPLVLFIRMGKKLMHRDNDCTSSDLYLPSSPVNSLLKNIFQSECFFLGRVSLPIGASIIACGRKMPQIADVRRPICLGG